MWYNSSIRIMQNGVGVSSTHAVSSHRKGELSMASSDHTTQPTTEEWRDIPGYEGLYQVSDFGRVRSSKQINLPNKLLKPFLNGTGYERVCLLSSKKKNWFIHHLVADAFLGDRPVGYVINHISGNRRDNRVINLEYVTQQDNARHAVRIGLAPTGENHHLSKVTQQMKAEILALKGHKNSRDTARQFGLSRSTITNIWSGRRRFGQ